MNYREDNTLTAPKQFPPFQPPESRHSDTQSSACANCNEAHPLTQHAPSRAPGNDKTRRSTVHIRAPSLVFERYAHSTPIAHAIFRTAELASMQGLELAKPIIDLGCGYGEIVAAIEGKIDVGVDLSLKRLAGSVKTQGYVDLIQGNLVNLPCKSNSFQTAISVSVFEHIAQPMAALDEAYRVLLPGGRLVATVVCREINECLMGSRVLRSFRARRLAQLYENSLHNAFHHISLLSKDEWRAAFERAGFLVEHLESAVSMGVIRCWERLLFTAWPHRLFPSLAKTLLPCRKPLIRYLLNKWRSELEVSFDARASSGACLFVIARKPKSASKQLPDAGSKSLTAAASSPQDASFETRS